MVARRPFPGAAYYIEAFSSHRGAAEIASVNVRREEGLMRGNNSATHQCPARYPAAEAHIAAKRVFDDKGLVRFFFKSKPRIVSRIRHIYHMSYRMRIHG